MNDKWELFQKFLITENQNIDITELIINAVLVWLLTYVLQLTYVKCAKSLSNRKMFANNFLILTFTTMIIITIVKSSLALSLGLVGALSIVRFRAAIKEPEELAYLFFAISIGLGLGANQREVVLVAFGLLMIVLWGKNFLTKNEPYQNLFLTISSSPKSVNFEQLQALMEKNFSSFDLKRLDEDADTIEVSYNLDIKNKASLSIFKKDVQDINDSIRVSFIDNKV